MIGLDEKKQSNHQGTKNTKDSTKTFISPVFDISFVNFFVCFVSLWLNVCLWLEPPLKLGRLCTNYAVARMAPGTDNVPIEITSQAI